ncbi:MAG: hypothetical protein ACUZ8O_06540 [Candidatus Anammoxibacter sp.]
MKSFKKIFRVLLINLIILSIILVLIESVFRFVNFPYKTEWTPPEHVLGQFDEELGWSYIPNSSHSVRFRERDVETDFDNDGIRVPYAGFRFDYSKPSVLFIGGSFTMGHGLAYEESFVGKFSSLDEVPYQVVNLGVQGFGSDQTLLSLKKFLLKFNTKVVVYTFISAHVTRNGNYDRRLILPGARYVGTKPIFKLNRKNELFLQKEAVLFKDYTNSYLIDFLKIRIGKMLGIFPPKPIKLTKAILQEMKKYSKEHGAHFVAINWRWKEKKYNYEDLFQDIHTISTLENAPKGWESMRIPDDNHPNERAGNHVTQLLLKYFRENNLL